MDKNQLMNTAKRARANAHAPYSRHAVGTALLGKSGRVYTGCNIENKSSGVTVCGERTAVFKAVSEGECEFLAIAVAAGPAEQTEGILPAVAPCAVCRQVLREFCDDDFPVYMQDGKGGIRTMTLGELLPDIRW